MTEGGPGAVEQPHQDVAAIVIGRNEGERLQRCRVMSVDEGDHAAALTDRHGVADERGTLV